MLIWQEGYFESNVDTVRGDIAHQAVDRGGAVTGRDGTKIWKSLPVYSDQLGMHGICDTVHWIDGTPTPIEHKSGSYRPGSAADLQVAAQALCLAEMFSADVRLGQIFAGKARRRYNVPITDDLIAAVHAAVTALREAVAAPTLPPAVNDKRCERCSLRPGCVPETATQPIDDLFRPRGSGNWQ
ncbi:hypothetical protein GCM10011591_20740 [Nocardia camponoti]|uniref:CRISPR-associated exonuclease Cas4 n=1 Tax=Nocardia camponoti TaxID=1616106 RepID=A0A917QHG1_9NOCA|nr:hypothetical protein GCM10011591_20740 [Nocardia camponoti]